MRNRKYLGEASAPQEKVIRGRFVARGGRAGEFPPPALFSGCRRTAGTRKKREPRIYEISARDRGEPVIREGVGWGRTPLTPAIILGE